MNAEAASAGRVPGDFFMQSADPESKISLLLL
jgi:hypothetical protein